MDQVPLISIVVPAYNEEQLLTNCLTALRRQTYPNLEIIVIDNNSTDRTAEIARKYKTRVISEKTQGMTYAREAGFRFSHGDIIIRTDADSIPCPDWVERIVKIFQTKNTVAVTGPTNFYDVVTPISILWFFCTIFVLIFDRLLMGHYPLNGPNCAFTRGILTSLHPHMDNKQIHEDMDLSCHVACRGKIMMEPTLVMPCSARRLKKNLITTLAEYIVRGFRTIYLHHSLFSWKHKPFTV